MCLYSPVMLQEMHAGNLLAAFNMVTSVGAAQQWPRAAEGHQAASVATRWKAMGGQDPDRHLPGATGLNHSRPVPPGGIRVAASCVPCGAHVVSMCLGPIVPGVPVTTDLRCT